MTTLEQIQREVNAQHEFESHYRDRADLFEILLREARGQFITFQDGIKLKKLVRHNPHLEFYCRLSTWAMKILEATPL